MDIKLFNGNNNIHFVRPTNSHAFRSVITHSLIFSQSSRNFTFPTSYLSITYTILFHGRHCYKSMPNDIPKLSLERVFFIWRQIMFIQTLYVIHCASWYHLYNLKSVKNTHGEVLLLVKLQAKSNTPPQVFFTFFKLYKWYQIALNITYSNNSHRNE